MQNRAGVSHWQQPNVRAGGSGVDPMTALQREWQEALQSAARMQESAQAQYDQHGLTSRPRSLAEMQAQVNQDYQQKMAQLQQVLAAETAQQYAPQPAPQPRLDPGPSPFLSSMPLVGSAIDALRRGMR